MVGPEIPTPGKGAAPEGRKSFVRLHRRGSALNVYVDSSALVKAFIDEPGRDELLEILAGPTLIATVRLAYVEIRAAFARAGRERRLSAPELRSVARALDQRWTQLGIIELDDTLAREASALADAHPLRASDAVHLAAAVSIAAEVPQSVTFACWDTRLWDEAQAYGFVMAPTDWPT